ncbi:hypothetical protein EYB66_09065 [Akkermansia muciniphila]|uniref:hypothetical protein n=2 Tax=Akkermansia muciniphila TaxID=239935 RepID=UPI001034441A|nr:hypothetical protein [Akkermansia muciniphila]QBH17420.1 hypothetical protein EYB66_09065 [Akkermansia muciniphila]QWP65555.1 hypothetical protein J5W61_10445 [Akkermansia muciniphila]
MMKRPLSTHRMIFACALAILSLSCSVLAQETPAAEGPPAQTEDSGISTPRRVAGLGVLAFLIGWMIWRSSSSRQKDGGHDQEAPRE